MFVELLDAMLSNGITTVVDRALAFDDAPGIAARRRSRSDRD